MGTPASSPVRPVKPAQAFQDENVGSPSKPSSSTASPSRLNILQSVGNSPLRSAYSKLPQPFSALTAPSLLPPNLDSLEPSRNVHISPILPPDLPFSGLRAQQPTELTRQLAARKRLPSYVGSQDYVPLEIRSRLPSNASQSSQSSSVSTSSRVSSLSAASSSSSMARRLALLGNAKSTSVDGPLLGVSVDDSLVISELSADQSLDVSGISALAQEVSQISMPADITFGALSPLSQSAYSERDSVLQKTSSYREATTKNPISILTTEDEDWSFDDLDAQNAGQINFERQPEFFESSESSLEKTASYRQAIAGNEEFTFADIDKAESTEELGAKQQTVALGVSQVSARQPKVLTKFDKQEGVDQWNAYLGRLEWSDYIQSLTTEAAPDVMKSMVASNDKRSVQVQVEVTRSRSIFGRLSSWFRGLFSTPPRVRILPPIPPVGQSVERVGTETTADEAQLGEQEWSAYLDALNKIS